MKALLSLLGTLGEKTTRTDLWVICAVACLVWALINSEESVTLFILGYMFADLIGKEVADVYKVKHYAENIRQGKGGSHSTSDLTDNASSDVDKD